MTDDALAPASLFDPHFIGRLERLTLLAKRLFSGEIKTRQRQRRGASLEFEEHRKYGPGDDLRLVDWNVYRRLGQLAVKRFRAERDLVLTLVVDDSDSMTTGSPEKRRAALALAAALGYIALQLFEELMLVHLPYSPGDHPKGYRGKGRLFEFFTDLERHVPGGRTDLPQSLRHLLARHHGRGRVALIGDFAVPGGFGAAFRYLAVRGLGGDVVHLTAPDELLLGRPFDGPIEVVDPESGERLELDLDETRRRAYIDAITRHLDDVGAKARQARLGYHRVSTAGDLERAVRGVLERGALLR